MLRQFSVLEIQNHHAVATLCQGILSINEGGGFNEENQKQEYE
jgi:hypothetical protein